MIKNFINLYVQKNITADFINLTLYYTLENVFFNRKNKYFEIIFMLFNLFFPLMRADDFYRVFFIRISAFSYG